MGRGLVAPFVLDTRRAQGGPEPHRVLAHCRVPLAQVRRMAHAGGAKINDVMLTLIDMAMHRYLDERGADPGRAAGRDIPVALADHGSTGNRHHHPAGADGPARRRARAGGWWTCCAKRSR